MMFSCLTMNPQPLHIDRHFAAQTEWGQPLMNSLFTLGLMIGISVNDLTVGTIIANLGMTEVKFPAPLFQGDTVSVTTEVAPSARAARGPTPASSSSSTRPSSRTARWWRNAGARSSCASAAGLDALTSLRSRRQREENPEGARLGADVVILDLEDSVAAAAKPKARAPGARSPAHRAAAPKLFVRVNALATGLSPMILPRYAVIRPDGLVLPKSEIGADVKRLIADGTSSPLSPSPPRPPLHCSISAPTPMRS